MTPPSTSWHSRPPPGDMEAVGRLYDALVGPIYRYVAVRVRRREDAEDLTHLVFERIFGALPRFKHNGRPFAAWAFRIARNAVIDHQRRYSPDRAARVHRRAQRRHRARGPLAAGRGDPRAPSGNSTADARPAGGNRAALRRGALGRGGGARHGPPRRHHPRPDLPGDRGAAPPPRAGGRADEPLQSHARAASRLSPTTPSSATWPACPTKIELDPLFRRRLRSDVINRFVAAREGLDDPVRARGSRGAEWAGLVERACTPASRLA